MKILLPIAAVLLVLAIGFAADVALQPAEFHIERTALMKAAPAETFAQVNDFHKWDAWSPWLKLDPNAKGTYEGPESGEGAIFRWAGNAEVGEGSMTILESKPHELIRIKLHFVKPFEDTAETNFTFKPEGNQTAVTWSMDGRNNFVSKMICRLLMDMEAMIGGKYEEGLAKMKEIVEAPDGAKPSGEGEKAKDGAGAKSADNSRARSSPESLAVTENQRVVEKYMEGFRKNDHALILSCLTDDVEWEIPGATRLSGKAAFDKEIENENFVGSPNITITRLIEEKDVVVAEGSVRTEKKGGGFLNLKFCDVFEMRAGKIKRLISYVVPVA
jgi:ketosteroid isomerase-like protein